MQTLIAFLKGKKTYIIGAIIFVLGGFQALGYKIPAEVFTFLGSLGLVSLRAGMAKTE